ncbi:MAG: DHHW family protein [Alistipes sp.]|nr:DHHW family protein [Alistipes sp.]
MKRSNKITGCVLILFICFFSLLSVFGKKRDYSDKENRSLADFPEITGQELISGGYGGALNSYLADHFAFRDNWITLGAEIGANVGEAFINGVYITPERLIAADNSYRHCLPENAAAVNTFSENYGGAVYFAAIPTSAGIYGELLPSYLVPATEKQMLDGFYGTLLGDIRKIDAYNILKMLSENYIYYRTDRKWTSYGAYCVYRTVIQKLGFMPVSYDKYTIRHVTDSFRGDLYSRTQHMDSKPDILDIYEYDDGTEVVSCLACSGDGFIYEKELYDIDAGETDSSYELYLGEPAALVTLTTTVNNDRRLLVIGDEFTTCFIPFLTKHYSEIAFASPKYMSKGLAEYLDPENYEQTLFLLGIDSLETDILSKIND